jgi:hypothetical protein
VYRFFVLKKVTKDADRGSCGDIMNHMSVSLKHLGHEPERNMSLTENNIRREIIIDDVNICIVTESFDERSPSSEENRMGP